MSYPDSIQRELVLPASRERVWAALTDPSNLAQWFAPECAFELEVGATMRLVWESGEVSRGEIEEIKPPETFSFRWHARITPFTDPLTADNSTRVTFTLAEDEAGTRLTVIESGLSGLPDDVRPHVLKENTSGWEYELAELVEYIDAGGHA